MEKLVRIEQVIDRLTAGAILTADTANRQAANGDRDRNHVNYGRLIEQLATLQAVGVEVDHGVWEDDGVLKISYLTIAGRDHIKHTVR